MPQLEPAIEKQLVVGVLNRIRSNDPKLYEIVLADFKNRLPEATQGLSGFADFFSAVGTGLSKVGDSLGKAITSGVSTYANVLVNRETSKLKVQETNAAVKAQVAEMQAALELQRQQTNDAVIQQQLLAQQKALYSAGNGLQIGGGGSTMTIALFAIGIGGLLYLALRPPRAGARR